MPSTTDFYVCWRNPATGEHGLVVGMNNVKENCAEWLEADEVADAFRRDGDGYSYYVGNHLAEPVLCPQIEIDETITADGHPNRNVRRAMYVNFIATAKELT